MRLGFFRARPPMELAWLPSTMRSPPQRRGPGQSRGQQTGLPPRIDEHRLAEPPQWRWCAANDEEEEEDDEKVAPLEGGGGELHAIEGGGAPVSDLWTVPVRCSRKPPARTTLLL